MADVGKPRAIESPEEFERLALDYIEWVKKNPVLKTITTAFQGVISYDKVPHARPMTQYGLAAHMGVGLSTLKDYGQREEFSAIFKKICAIMTAHNVDGATCAGLASTLGDLIDCSYNIAVRLFDLAIASDINDHPRIFLTCEI